MTKNILIIGENSYIGKSFIRYSTFNNYDLKIDEISSKDNNWKIDNISDYDVIFHVAGIAHQNRKDISDEDYYNINYKLAVEVAKYARENKVRQFIFMSSMIVYGESSKIGQNKIITKDTIETPVNAYGDSKLQADKNLQAMNDSSFLVASLRPPMIYGPGSKGNFPLLKKIAKISPIFPNITNERSMLYIDNLCEFIYQVINRELSGIFYPQNEEYVCTSDMVKEIAKQDGKKIHLSNAFNHTLKKMSGRLGLVDKIFGNLVYDPTMSNFELDYQVVDFEKSIKNVVRKEKS